ncbi:MAG TPA: polysaccharide biosynthesis/export family protein [Candidatus Acidoferrales bacterium]|nr:polysaccharide biosynthesis/export family protein [Candidatus Acidoferrales bacterium]
MSFFTVRSTWDGPEAKYLLLLPLMLCLCVPAWAQTKTAANPPQKLETSQQTNEKIEELAALDRVKPVETPIGVGDLLHIDVFDVPELSRDVRVSDTGDIGYPLIPGKIKAAGFTHFQLEQEMEQLLVENGLVSHPQVTVFVREQTSQPISIVGAVMHPMVYQVVRPTTLLEMLAMAGGIADTAGSEIKITRTRHTDEPALKTTSASMSTADTDSETNGDQQVITIHLQDLLESGNAVYNIPVYGGDVISVPAAGMVYVMGAGVAQAGGYVLSSRGEQITVLKAVALAHGLNGYAKPDSSVIMRNNPVTGQRDTIPVRIKKIENRKADDVVMKPNDILYIPDSAGKKALARGAEAAIGIGTGAAIYRTAN